MANIMYGVSGQGFGHSARSHEVLAHLKKRGHNLLVLTYAQALGVMKKDFPTVEIPGLGLNYQNNRVSYSRTIYDNALMLFRSSTKWPTLLRRIRAFKPDLVITDFEPLSAVLAHFEDLPLISFNNQHQLTNTALSVPKKYQNEFRTTKLVIQSMIWGARYYLITSFFKTPITKPNTFLFPPVVREAVRRLKPRTGNSTLVYQTAEFDIFSELKKLAPKRFIVYCNREDSVDGNIRIKKHNPQTFLADLKNCNAIIATAGSSLAFEALYLNKPYFAIPVAKQVEQTINAIYIKKLGFGEWAETFTAAKGKKFLSSLSVYRRNLQRHPKPTPTALFKKLDAIIKSLSHIT